jgi:hypothetical protein
VRTVSRTGYPVHMSDALMLWAGKPLTPEEEARARAAVAFLERAGEPGLAATFRRFLPEHDAAWTPDELELAAGTGPWLAAGASAGEGRPPT